MDAQKGSNQDRTGEIKGERGSALCDHGMDHDPHVIVTVDRSSQNLTVHIFRAEIPLKNQCSSLIFLAFDRIVKKLSNLKGRS